ncbi:MAG: endonuclease MutS2 [Thermomicrobiales bacterium]|nr:endonuclease MutS2 [Thermomicrobiales bacterium]
MARRSLAGGDGRRCRSLDELSDITIGGARDIRSAAERAGKGSRLLPTELMAVADTARAARLLRKAVQRLPDASQRFPQLLDLSTGLIDAPNLETTIARAIGPAGEVLDSASPALARIRKEVRIAHGRLMDRLNRFVTSGGSNPALQDSIVTSRDGRYVVPVRADSRNQVPGVVHDVSASGQTIFVEPMEVVELNNRWREAQIDETREVERILDEISHQVGAYATELRLTVDSVARIDFAMAKGRLAFAMRATRPNIWSQLRRDDGLTGHPSQRIRLRRARHPLLDQKTVVPIDIDLGADFRVLLITGPNTGGKTVALKTVGLLAAMAQAGLFIPADDQSVLPVFTSFFVDIGDDQSIAQSLSTFSAHIASVIAMLEDVEPTSLVLIDEVGSGTDPVEGSALARSIIGELLDRGPLVLATTHYSEVKNFAYETPGVENASVEFDVETLQPTYRVVIGVPGQSNALSIARRLGLSERVLERAGTYIDSETVRTDELLSEIREIRDRAERELAQAEHERQLQVRLREEMAEERRNAEIERLNARDDAFAAAEAELAGARAAVRRLQQAAAARPTERPAIEKPQAELDKAIHQVKEFRRTTVAQRPRQQTPVLSVGDRVQVTTLGLDGEIASIEGDSAEVVMGGLRLRQPVAALKRLGGPRREQVRQVSIGSGAGFVPMEIDVRGERVAEVEAELERYLDTAYRANLPSVRIIHGKGTGALRQAVKRQLQAHPAVSRSELGGHGEGGDGVTIAYFRED